MAVKVEFEGWVNEVKVFDWGTVLKVSHDQRAKNDAGEWETIGKDYFDVTVTAEQASAIAAAKVIKVAGTLKVGTYVKKDGTNGVALKVRAQEVSPVERGFKGDPVATVTQILKPTAVEDIPF